MSDEPYYLQHLRAWLNAQKECEEAKEKHDAALGRLNDAQIRLKAAAQKLDGVGPNIPEKLVRVDGVYVHLKWERGEETKYPSGRVTARVVEVEDVS